MKIMRAEAFLPYSLAVVEDPKGGKIADPGDGKFLFAATPTSVTIACLIDSDGPTSFSLGPSLQIDPGRPHDFEGRVKTPSRMISIRTAEAVTILDLPVESLDTLIRIWVNRLKEPTEVLIGVVALDGPPRY